MNCLELEFDLEDKDDFDMVEQQEPFRVNLDYADWGYPFERAVETPSAPPCEHKWVNVSFVGRQMVCAKCDQEQVEGNK